MIMGARSDGSVKDDLIVYGVTPSVYELRGAILDFELKKLDGLHDEFKLAATGTDGRLLRSAMKSLYLQTRECVDRASREGVDDIAREEAKARVMKIMGDATRMLKESPLDNLLASEEFVSTEALYGGHEAYQSALDAGETELDYDEWVLVRMNAFKFNDVDWQAALNKEHSLSESPFEISVDSVVPEGVNSSDLRELSDWAAGYYAANDVEAIFHKELGVISIDEDSLRESFAHETSEEKQKMLAALNKVIPQSQVLHREAISKNQSAYLLGTVVKVGGKDYIATMVVKRDLTKNSLQLHQLQLREQLITEHTAKRRTIQAVASIQGEGKYDAIHLIALNTIYARTDMLKRNNVINKVTKEPTGAHIARLRKVPHESFTKTFEHYHRVLKEDIVNADAEKFKVSYESMVN